MTSNATTCGQETTHSRGAAYRRRKELPLRVYEELKNAVIKKRKYSSVKNGQWWAVGDYISRLLKLWIKTHMRSLTEHAGHGKFDNKQTVLYRQ